ncbi:hypothetical protein XENOCAPTIV_025288 [Xenoophorus captivus]|uniref:Sulfotransferase n=1 Tax=Xenoophorus captivus TaxID=1517983 RepID=A0ABV0S937_9TELE
MEPEAHQYLLQSVEEPCVDIYQGFIEPETPSSAGVRSSFLIWKPWIQALAPCGPIPALPHVTLFYDRNEKQTDWFQEQFEEYLEGKYGPFPLKTFMKCLMKLYLTYL